MSSATFDAEKAIPGVAEQRAQERQNRALAFAGITHTVCGREIMPMTPGHRLQLQLVKNAFAIHPMPAPSLADVFVFLWVLSPLNRGTDIESMRQQRFLREDVMQFDLRASVREIIAYMLDQMQDSNESSGEGRDNSKWIHWCATEAEFWIAVHGGFTMEEYQRTPYLVLQQLLRAWKVNNPDMERKQDGSVLVRDPVFFNASDRLIGAWRRKNHDAIKAYHLGLKERRN